MQHKNLENEQIFVFTRKFILLNDTDNLSKKDNTMQGKLNI